MPGDIILFDGHMGIVETYDLTTGTGTFFGSQSSTGPASTIFGTGYWDYTKFKGIYRPQTSTIPDGKKTLELSRELFNQGETIQPTSPIILDLDGDGVETINLKDGAYFDHDCNGFAEQTGWVGYDDGVLVRDINGNGVIDNGVELFGNETILSGGGKAANGFIALADLDSNADGRVDTGDAAWGELKVWRDFDGDGFSTVDELFTLDAAGVQSIDTGYSISTYIDTNGNEHRQAGTFTRTPQTLTFRCVH